VATVVLALTSTRRVRLLSRSYSYEREVAESELAVSRWSASYVND
jgi:hypothetical protein